MKKFASRSCFITVAVVVLLSAFTSAAAQTGRERSTKKAREAAEQSAKAARVFDQIMATREKSIPRDLLDRADAVAVFPGVIKAGFIVGRRGGRGVIGRPVPGRGGGRGWLCFGRGAIGVEVSAA